MRVGGTSHHAGMSALWHDPDFEPVRQFQAPVVQRTFDDLPLPTERHELPDGVKDPFQKLDEVYDAAAVQMERGIKGAEFLHGRKPVAVNDPPPQAALHAKLQEQPVKPASPEKQLDKQTRDHHRRLDEAANTKSVKPQGTTKTAADKETEAATNAGAVDADSAINAAMTFGPMVAAQVAASSVQGPLAGVATQATQALQTVNTVAAAGEVALTGVEAAKDDASVKEGPRRGLSRK